MPPGVSPEAEPDWVEVGSSGNWGWHDHRIHWMSPDRPPWLDGAGPSPEVAFDWTVPLTVDGEMVEVSGTLTWHPEVSPVPWLGLAAVAAGLVIALGRYPAAIGAGLAGGGALAAVVSVAQLVENPPGAGADVVSLLVAGVAVAAGMVAAASGRKRPSVARATLVTGAVLLVVWGVQRLDALWLPVLPGLLPETVVRPMIALVVGLALGVTVSLARMLARGPEAGVSR